MRSIASTSLAALLAVIGCGGATISGTSDLTASDDAGADDLAVSAFDLRGSDLTQGPPCGTGTCQPGEVCEFATCHPDCARRIGPGSVRCGEQAEVCCKLGDVCYLGACVTPGKTCTSTPSDGGVPSACSTTACPDKQYCEPSIGRCLPLGPTSQCEYKPPVGAFGPKIKWQWTGSPNAPEWNQVMMTPMVGDLDGDCMPDVVFSTFTGSNYTTNGVLRAVRGDGKGELWSVTDPALRVKPGAQVALADTDGDGKLEVYACHEDGRLVAFKHDGTTRWLTNAADKPCLPQDAPFVADLNHDGFAEIVVGFDVFSAPSGSRVGIPASIHPYYSTAAEIDGDPSNGMELVGGGIVIHADGTPYWTKDGPGFPAVADLDGDGRPEIVAVFAGTHTIRAYRFDGTPLWGPIDINNGVATPNGPNGGGPPTIADFDGDGKPDVATAGGYGYLVLVGQTGKVLWQNTDTRDYSSRVTGSSVFDFEGDGAAEAVYNDELNLRVYRGRDGTVLVKLCSTSGTLYEYPVIVDVDADDHADIVVMDNNYAFKTCDQDTGGGPSTSGFKVISDAQNRWVRTRRIWNQHTYHVTNVLDDGKIPKNEPENWKQPGLNNFRQNVQTRNLFAAPDLVPQGVRAGLGNCDKNQLLLVAQVVNRGAAGAPAGISVSFWQNVAGGAPKLLGTAKTTAQILPGAVESVSLPWTPPGGDAKGPFGIFVIVDDDGARRGAVNECDETNNQSRPAILGCPTIG